MFSYFESLIDVFRLPEKRNPPETLVRFYLHYTLQVWPWLVGLMVTGFAIAIIEVALFQYVGSIVDLLSKTSPEKVLHDHGRLFAWMLFVILVLRPVANIIHETLTNQILVPPFTNIVRWQSHHHVLRQSVGFFSNDFAGRVASRVMQTGPALRESVLQIIESLWYVVIYAGSALFLFAQADWRLALPLAVWIALYIAILVWFVPRLKDRAAIMSESRSMLNGRVVDSYTNIQTVKMFAHASREDEYAREAIVDHTHKFQIEMRLITLMDGSVTFLNSILIAGTGILAVWLWSIGSISLGAIALASGLVIRITNMSNWVMWVVTGIFENVGTVQEGMDSIARPHTVTDTIGAKPLVVDKGSIEYDHVRFHYGKEGGVLDDLTLDIKPGEKVGLVGPSGAGKSTLVNLLLRFYDLESGAIRIDGQNIADVQQDTLRASIGMVTQDTSLLHRSVRDNIRYGRPDASERDIERAAQMARADVFIPDLSDLSGRTGLDAHVGERGVKLSGGQRQRIAIARVLLKDAPILILDEATSALDSEVEAVIQESLYDMMAGKTVIAIAHRLSTIAAMDRLVVMDHGRVVEQGTHADLLEREGVYARLWSRQSGGFLVTGRPDGAVPA